MVKAKHPLVLLHEREHQRHEETRVQIPRREMDTSDLVGATVVAVFAAAVMVVHRNLPRVNEALHYYREHDRSKFIAMRTCHVIISTGMAMNLRYVLGWFVRVVWKRVVVGLGGVRGMGA